jgi:hypothetical protein
LMIIRIATPRGVTTDSRTGTIKCTSTRQT